MGNDTPLAVLSDRPQVFFNYFRQQFAQVTNPAIDPLREELVMSLTEYIGRVGSGILSPDETNCKMVRLPHPILNNTQLDILCNIRYKGFNTIKLPMVFSLQQTHSQPLSGSESSAGLHAGEALREALDKLCKDAEKAVDDGYNYIILTDKLSVHAADGGEGAQACFIPSLLAVSAVHHYLISVGKRVQTALIVESGEIRETMHAALLLGYGASALCPYMTFAVLDDLVKHHKIQEDYATAEANYIKAVKKGLFKIMAKMGISTIRSYRGAKIFESIGLSESLLKAYFGTEVSTIGGIGLDKIALDALAMQRAAAKVTAAGSAANGKPAPDFLPNQGQFRWRKDGIRHAWNPETIATLQLATRTGSYAKFKEFTRLVDEKESPIFIRDFMGFKKAGKCAAAASGMHVGGAEALPIDEVEPVSEIVKHFVAGAMSFGALSKEAHEAICLAMNKLGARSNTGEGGEDSERFHTEVDGISLSSKTKQVASGRFGVTTEYLVNAEEIQIKVAQGAKPGEGGQLPGFKVNEVIARTRHSIPGISLISPPPHHDIYSIEDLAQLIFDLKNVNPTAAVSVKLVAESGVGTIAAGVAKAKADLIVISGAEGGTGASPASSMRFAGISPEIGLSETQQTLVRNGLRSNVRLQVDGQIKTGRDVVLMALLGAEEFGFGTAPLIVLGCVMMRKCNLNTCPMGVATQSPELRKHFMGHYTHLVNYFTFLAQEVREYLAEMGFRSLNDIVGRTDLIETQASVLDFSRLLAREEGVLHFTGDKHVPSVPLGMQGRVLDQQIMADLEQTLPLHHGGGKGGAFTGTYAIKNTDRAVGAMLSGGIAKKYGMAGLPDGSVNVKFRGSAGQSFGAFLTHGVTFRLEGETNDYFAKGLSGGRIAILPPTGTGFAAEENIISGNTGLYGATSGELYINGRVGERFGVRNSGAIAVIEGAGDHCCEYMTGGRVVVLGETGRNFAAGMSGGVAYVYDPNHKFDYFCNMDMVEINLVEDNVSRKELLGLISRHAEMTGSKLARMMLDEWSCYVDDFIQVVPIEYKRVLQEEQIRRLQEKIKSIQE
jgi:glutamate synthase (NADPH/NADH) large chain